MELIVRLLNEWDPIGLLPYAPDDEYIVEAKRISEYINQHPFCKIDDLAKAINEIFIKSFGADIYKDNYSACYSIAKSLLDGNRLNW